MVRIDKRGDMKILQIFFTVGLGVFFCGCSNTVSDKPKKASKESDVTPACQTAKLKPVMTCGDYVIVKGRINSSQNLERVNETTMLMSGLTNADSNTLVNKTVLLSGKCSSEIITGPPLSSGVSGGFFTHLYLNDAKLLQKLNGNEINKGQVKQFCKSLKSSSG